MWFPVTSLPVDLGPGFGIGQSEENEGDHRSTSNMLNIEETDVRVEVTLWCCRKTPSERIGVDKTGVSLGLLC